MTISTTSIHIVRTKSSFLWVLLLIMLTSVARAEDTNVSTDAMLETLKQRSAEERWERIKKMYPPNARQSRPAQLPADAQEGNLIPPSPAASTLIPRMEPLADTSDDWLVPRREIPADDQAEPQLDAQPTEQDSLPAPVRIATQDVNPPAAEQTTAPVMPRALHERRITEIQPHYDRERDTDIRRFAIEKGREMDIEFKPKSYTPRCFPEIVLAWEASNFTHRPLYFSDPALERYGHCYNPIIQPVASIARVGTQFVFWPYQATITPINKPESPLGWYRPGDVVPKLTYQVPLNAEAAAVEAGAITGLYFFIVP